MIRRPLRIWVIDDEITARRKAMDCLETVLRELGVLAPPNNSPVERDAIQQCEAPAGQVERAERNPEARDCRSWGNDITVCCSEKLDWPPDFLPLTPSTDAQRVQEILPHVLVLDLLEGEDEFRGYDVYKNLREIEKQHCLRSCYVIVWTRAPADPKTAEDFDKHLSDDSNLILCDTKSKFSLIPLLKGFICRHINESMP